VVKGALEVVKDVLRISDMGLTRVVHVKTHIELCRRYQTW
jgi:hypothetical protein